MRSTIAKRMNTHALDDRLVTLLPEQLMTLFMDAKEQETEDIKRVADWVKLINDAWVQNFSNLFEDLKVFVNPELFQKIQEHKAMDEHRETVNEQNFEQVWQDMLKVIPQSLQVEETSNLEHNLPIVDEETERVLAGWVPYQPPERA